MNRASRYLANVTFLTFVRVVIVGVIVCICHHATPSDGKIFERCELAQLLRYGHGLDVNDVANWVCIAQHSSSLNSSAFGGDARSGSHGLFQISDQYWCSPPGKGVACGVTCDRLRDDDIGDDLECIRVIYQEHQRLSGDGYNAWIAYQQYCRDNPYEYIEDCFGNEEREYLHSKSITATNYIEDEEEEKEEYDPYSKKRGKVYGRCELAKELFLKHKMPMDEIPTWVCIAQHESNYDTSAVGRLNTDGSADHGLFQISDLYWCSHKGGRRKACGLPCSKLLDSDISDDVKCVKQIYKEHTRISGDGFTAWTVYNAYCHGRTADYIRGCFDGVNTEASTVSEEYRKPPKPSKGDKHPPGNGKPHGKVYDPCELAEELRSKHHLPEDQIATWVCIAKYESDYNTSAIGYGDHGLFQISDIYWCSPPGKGWACGLSCADLEDSDISDDVECIRKIYEEHTRLSGDGFNAWTVYPRHCSEGRSEKYISHCSLNHPRPAVTAPPHTYSKLINPNSIEDDYQPKRGKIYGRCELAKELLTKHEMPMDEIPTWVCIAQHESNYDTSAVGRLNTDGSADHGLFQISDLYWCSHKDGHRKACGLPCSKLLDNDITDDIRCVKQIHNEHTRISGDGFTAWTVYNAYCRERTEQYIRGCFDGTASAEDFKPRQRAIEYGYLPKNKPKGKVYEECELAKELRDKHRIPKDQISTWICIAKHQSGLNTSSSVSDVHGMFHISDEYWCSPPGKGKVCELHCSDLEDSDISDDVECINKIYLEHQRLFGNGFSAWVVYPQHCSNGRADDYVGHCPGFESSTTNAISYASPKLINSNKPVYNHVFNGNPFLKHVELVNNDAASKFFSEPIEESFSASDEVDTVVPANHEFSLNPFLKTIKVEQPKPIQIPIKTTASQPAFLGIPITPTPTKSTRAQTYEPKNEEHAKYEAFKAFATPSLPLNTQKPRANRLQTYKLNTSNAFKTFATPSLPTIQPPVPTNRLQPYQLNTFNSFRTTPIVPTLSTKIGSIKPLTTVQPKPYSASTTRTPPTLGSKESGRYDAGRYDSGRYDAGRYDPGRYNSPKSQAAPTASLNTNSKIQTKPVTLSGGQHPIATPTLQTKPPSSIKISSTSLSVSKPLVTSIHKTELTSNTKFPAIATNSGRYEPFKPLTTPPLTTKAPSAKFDPFKQFSTTTFKPISTTTSSKKFDAQKAVNSGKYIPYKPPSNSKESGKYIPDKSLATPSLPTKSSLSSAIRTTTTIKPTKKFDPFKPFGGNSGSYDPFKAFTTGQKQSSSFSFLSGKATSSNELDFALSSNSKRETETSRNPAPTVRSSMGDLRSSSTIKRETKVSADIIPTQSRSGGESLTESKKSGQEPTISTSSTRSAQQQKPVITVTPLRSAASSIAVSTKPSVTPAPIRSGTLTSSIRSTKPQVTSTLIRSNVITPPFTRSVSTIAPATRSIIPSSRSPWSSTQTRSVDTIAVPKPFTTSKPTTRTKSVIKSTSTRSVIIPSTTKPTSVLKPSLPVTSQLTATPIRSTRSVSSSGATNQEISITSSKSSSSKDSQQLKTGSKTSSLSTEPIKISAIETSKPTLSNDRQYAPTPTRSVDTSGGKTKSVTTKPIAPISSPFKTAIKTTPTVATPQPSLVPTRTQSQGSLNPSKVTTIPTKSPTRSTTTSKRPSIAISPTKSHRSSESLYSSRLNIFDLYYKLYGVHPPLRTSSALENTSKTSQTNVVPSHTS